LGRVVVDDPLEAGAKLKVSRNLREHPLHILHHNGRLDDAQLIAGELFRRQWEAAAVAGAMSAGDLSKIKVDGGGRRAGEISNRSADAIGWLNKVVRYEGVGKVGFSVLVQICGEGRGIAETTAVWEGAHVVAGARGAGFVLGRLIEALDGLIEGEGEWMRKKGGFR
jgi:hypothetical protein